MGNRFSYRIAFTDGPPIRDYRSFAAHVDADLYHRFARLMLEEGVRLIPRGLWYVSAAHTDDDVAFTLQAAESAMSKLQSTSD